jgi:hypothetical protein
MTMAQLTKKLQVALTPEVEQKICHRASQAGLKPGTWARIVLEKECALQECPETDFASKLLNRFIQANIEQDTELGKFIKKRRKDA